MRENELYHHGVKGMKWGVRRSQRDANKLKKQLVKLLIHMTRIENRRVDIMLSMSMALIRMVLMENPNSMHLEVL